MVSQSVGNGQLKPQSTWGEFNNIAFMVQQAIGKMQTATLVRIEACTNAGADSPVGYVDVTPLINQIDNQGSPTPHVTIHNLPYLRLQGGANAIIMDPQKGDVGVAVFASRDISKVKATKKQGNPGSFRQYSFADGMYLGGMLNGIPSQYVQFSTAGITIHSPTAIVLEAPDIKLNAPTIEINGSTSTTITTPSFIINGASTFNGSISQAGGATSTFSGDVAVQGTSVHNHIHTSTTPGTPTSPPL